MKLMFSALIFLASGLTDVPAQDEGDVIDEIFAIGSVQSVLIEQNGELIEERHAEGVSPGNPVNIKSASKSILSLLIGIAIDRGYLEGVDQTIDEFFPDYFEQNPDSEKEAITIQDLLTMRGGLESTSMRNYGRWVVSNNWIVYKLSRELVAEPGGRMIYSTGTSHLLSVILTRASGMNTREFAARYLFGPLNAPLSGWDRDPQGYFLGGNNMPMLPQDMIKIGRLMLNGGEWNGERIVSEEWIRESVQAYTRSNFNPYDHGYMWWQKPVAGYDTIFAWGHGGQYIVIIPELDAVIAATSNLFRNEGRGYQRQFFRYLDQRLVPYLKETHT